MIDLHCHILPYLDDGPQSPEESLSMAKEAVEDGISVITATPHTLNGVYLNPAQKITKSVAALQDLLVKNNIPLQMCLGADVHLCPDMLAHIESGEAMTINNAGKYLLLEFPAQSIPPGAKDEIFRLKLNGITPIITHPERNLMIQKDIHILYEFVNLGALSQVTAMSITGDFGPIVRNCVQELLERRLAHIIASDAHSPDDRPPLLSEALEEAADMLESYEEAEQMVTLVPAAIIAGEGVEIQEPERM